MSNYETTIRNPQFFLYRIEPRYVITIEEALMHYIEEKEDFTLEKMKMLRKREGKQQKNKICYEKINKSSLSNIYFGGREGIAGFCILRMQT